MQKALLYQRFIFGSLLLLFLTACGGNKKHYTGTVYLNELTGYVNAAPEFCTTPNLDFTNCKEPADTLRQNLPFNYDEAMRQLKSKFDSVDVAPVSTQSKQLIKSIICADFVYAACSYRYLGDELGMNNDTVLATPWDSLPLSACYQLANNNFKAVYCNERTTFYLRLVKELLGLSGEITSKDHTHTFPLLLISDSAGNARPYLVDPYDPFVITIKGSNEILPFNNMGSDTSSIEVHRTQRMFGKTRSLVSIPLLSSLKISAGVSQYCSLLTYTSSLADGYIKSHGALDTVAINLPNFAQAQLLQSNSRFKYALSLNGRPDGQLFDQRSYAKYYIR